MKKIGIFIITIILMAVSTAVRAEITPGVYSLTPYVGGYLFEGNEGLKNTYTVGLRLGLNLTENLGMESFFSLTPTEIDYEGGDNVRMWSYGIEGVYNFMPESRFVPFIAVGIGGIYYDTLGFTEKMNKFAFDYGGGVKYFINDKLALRADVRHVIPVSDNYNDLLVTFGVSYAFGAKRKSIASVSEETYAPQQSVAPAKVEAPPAQPTETVAAAPAPAHVVAESPAPFPAPEVVAPAPIEIAVSSGSEQKEAESNIDEDIKNLVNKWRESWQSGDMQTYRACYAPKFNSKGKNLDAWVAYKTKMYKRSKNIQISIENLIVTPDSASNATVVFTQNYSSSLLQDSGEKTLKLIKINNEWKIYEEVM